MSNILYRLTCLTNLHMGSGDINYDVIDLEVERDPVLMEPTMNASGVKGALRDYCKKTMSDDDLLFVFGGKAKNDDDNGAQRNNQGTQQGFYNFFSGDMLARPIRISEGEGAYLLATTPDILKTLLRKLHAFGFCIGYNENDIPALPQDGSVLSPVNIISVEGQKVTNGTCAYLSALLGSDHWVLMSSQQLRDIDLPVLAHNVLEDGISKNLWYEQVVPHESVFLLIISGLENDDRLSKTLTKKCMVQFGAGATTGNGYTLMEQLEV